MLSMTLGTKCCGHDECGIGFIVIRSVVMHLIVVALLTLSTKKTSK
jgi:hypothetical protein